KRHLKEFFDMLFFSNFLSNLTRSQQAQKKCTILIRGAQTTDYSPVHSNSIFMHRQCRINHYPGYFRMPSPKAEPSRPIIKILDYYRFGLKPNYFVSKDAPILDSEFIQDVIRYRSTMLMNESDVLIS